MAHDDKPFILKKYSEMTREERLEAYRLIDEKAEKEGRSSDEVFQTAMVRRGFANMGQGDFFDQKLVESRKNGEDYMEFLLRMSNGYLAH